MQHFSTHKPAPRPESFPAGVRHLGKRFESHDTPKHDSWLDMVESERAVLSRPCLDRRLTDTYTAIRKVAAWQTERNTEHANPQPLIPASSPVYATLRRLRETRSSWALMSAMTIGSI